MQIADFPGCTPAKPSVARNAKTSKKALTDLPTRSGQEMPAIAGRPDVIATTQTRSKKTKCDQPLLVLLVAANIQKRARLERVLMQGAYRVMTANSARDAMNILRSWGNCQLIMFHEVPDMTSLEFCASMRANQDDQDEIPVVLVADYFNADQAVNCLRAGANDYISGPHLEEPRVLLARLGAILRTRHRATPEQIDSGKLIELGSLTIDPIKYRAFINHETLELTKIQFHLLYTLARRPGRVFSHVQLREMIAKHGGNPDERTVKSHIFHLRKRLGSAGAHIQTVRGLGYMISESD